MTTAWAHLPNATHIDRVLAHAAQHPGRWAAALGATRGATLDPDRAAARSEAWHAAGAAARYDAWDAALDAALDAAGDAALDAAWDAAWGAIAALIAWDDCAPILDMPADAVRLLAAVGHHPAVLMLPAVLAMNGETK